MFSTLLHKTFQMSEILEIRGRSLTDLTWAPPFTTPLVLELLTRLSLLSMFLFTTSNTRVPSLTRSSSRAFSARPRPTTPLSLGVTSLLRDVTSWLRDVTSWLRDVTSWLRDVTSGSRAVTSPRVLFWAALAVDCCCSFCCLVCLLVLFTVVFCLATDSNELCSLKIIKFKVWSLWWSVSTSH